MNHVSLIEEARIARIGPSAETPSHRAREAEIVAPPTTKTTPTAGARGHIVHQRVITPTEGLAEFDWVI